jgi:hypothetical protein
MVIYFTGSIGAKDRTAKHYLEIINKLISRGHTVVADHILNTTEKMIAAKPRKERLEFHKKMEEWVQSANCIIAETSYPSVSVGYEIGLASRIGKPVLVLYSAGDGPSLLTEHKSDHIITQRYTSANLGSILDNFLGFVKDYRDVKFTFFINPKLVKYLDEVSQDNDIPKSVYLRRLIEEDMKKRSGK